MKFNREKLREAVQSAIEEYEQTQQNRQAEYEAGLQRHRDEWFRLYHDKWRTALSELEGRVRRGEPVIENDLPRDESRGFGRVAFYREMSVDEHGWQISKPNGSPEVPPELLALRKILDITPDNEISSSALKEMGVGRLSTVAKYLR